MKGTTPVRATVLRFGNWGFTLNGDGSAAPVPVVPATPPPCLSHDQRALTAFLPAEGGHPRGRGNCPMRTPPPPTSPPRRLTLTKWDAGRAWEWIPNPGFPGASSCLPLSWTAAGCGCCLTWWFVLGC